MPILTAVYSTYQGYTVSVSGPAVDANSFQFLLRELDLSVGQASAIISNGELSMQAVQQITLAGSTGTVPNTATCVRVYAPNASGTLALTIDPANAIAGQALEVDVMQTSSGTQCSAITLDGTVVASLGPFTGSGTQPAGFPYLSSPISPNSEAAGIDPYVLGTDAFPLAINARFTDAGVWSFAGPAPLI